MLSIKPLSGCGLFNGLAMRSVLRALRIGVVGGSIFIFHYTLSHQKSSALPFQFLRFLF